ncbi:transposase [Cereibacter azotoformans]|nr:transposase [Cereibacter azotoformans]ULB11874.1 transposase [Cereibacter azotoformans]
MGNKTKGLRELSRQELADNANESVRRADITSFLAVNVESQHLGFADATHGLEAEARALEVVEGQMREGEVFRRHVLLAGREDNAANSGETRSGQTHLAGLERAHQDAIGEVCPAERGGGPTDRYDLGVLRGIGGEVDVVDSFRNDLPVAYQRRRDPRLRAPR